MGKVYGLHALQLRPGVTGDDFERFVANNIQQWPRIPGWRIAILKGDRGDQVGQYLALVELDSIEARRPGVTKRRDGPDRRRTPVGRRR